MGIPSARILLVDSDGTALSIDDVTNAINVMQYEHHEIHEGNSFVISGTTTLNAGEYYNLLITTNSTSYPHLVGVVRSSGEATVLWYEGPTLSANGTAITPINRNRSSAATADTATYSNPTWTSTGSLLFTAGIGAGSKTGGEERAIAEWILDTSQSYILRVLSAGNGNNLSFALDWYEK